ncbi:Undecaprenyl-phosphate N-acetylglucosaminyl 1-phosphate transferase [Klebsiella pneumoniae]|nr:Undecaprenyl-phosphate N-acetylglucosaminyl 1-phosphate transferase [Klebsiella pneumoniae]
MIAAILPYIMLNLGILGRRYKVFMGDAGSTLIGFTVIWILLETTQGKTHPISPVTALWIIAIPLMDMVAIMYRRLRKGMSPFSPDRQHIHHLPQHCSLPLACWQNILILSRSGSCWCSFC